MCGIANLPIEFWAQNWRFTSLQHICWIGSVENHKSDIVLKFPAGFYTGVTATRAVVDEQEVERIQKERVRTGLDQLRIEG